LSLHDYKRIYGGRLFLLGIVSVQLLREARQGQERREATTLDFEKFIFEFWENISLMIKNLSVGNYGKWAGRETAPNLWFNLLLVPLLYFVGSYWSRC